MIIRKELDLSSYKEGDRQVFTDMLSYVSEHILNIEFNKNVVVIEYDEIFEEE